MTDALAGVAMAPLNTAHLIWFLPRRFAEEPPTADRTARELTVDRCALELNALDDAVRVRAIGRLRQLATAYERHPGYKPEWRH